MGYIGEVAARTPAKLAIVLGGSGASTSFGELDARTNRLAHWWRRQGLGIGDHVAIFAENHLRYMEPCWAAERSGLYYTPINSHLTADEVAYIVRDCGAKVLVTSPAREAVAREVARACPNLGPLLVFEGSYEEALAGMPATPIADETAGSAMFYSSGTTGRPKGILRRLSGAPPGAPGPFEAMFRTLYGMSEDTVYLSPAPLYHTAPLGFCMTIHRLGATTVVMERFDPERALALVERHRITHSQWVPTMFVRMLKLPEAVRRRYDLSSMRAAIHAAAPCPIPVKEQMIAWWGPIVLEYYGATEAHGITFITAADWLAHKGSVGRAIFGTPRIFDDEGRELPPGEVGVVWFTGGSAIEYHNDAEKTAQATNGRGAYTVGDVGYLDADGYLYLTDRKSHMIISGGVNVYPQEAENVLVTHPLVADAAVIGVPHEEMGEEVKAVVELVDPRQASPELAAELVAWCRDRLAHYKCPRSLDFDPALPRLENGKLYKRLLRERYWSGRTSRIV